MSRDIPLDLERTSFALSPFGYSRWQVDEVIRRLQETLREERHRLRDLEAEAAGLRLGQMATPTTASSHNPEDSVHVLAMAHQVAEQTRQEAEREAAAIRELARQQSQQEVVDARAELSQLRYDIDKLRAEKHTLLEEYRSFLHGRLESLDAHERAFIDPAHLLARKESVL